MRVAAIVALSTTAIVFVAAVVMSTARSDASDRSATAQENAVPAKRASPIRSEPRSRADVPPKPRPLRGIGRRVPWDPSPIRIDHASVDADTDEAARVQFDAAFDQEERDEVWAGATEAAIADAIATSEGIALRAAECRSTLCRVDLRGDRNALPPIAPFDGVTWWLGDGDESTLLIVREGADLPLPASPED